MENSVWSNFSADWANKISLISVNDHRSSFISILVTSQIWTIQTAVYLTIAYGVCHMAVQMAYRLLVDPLAKFPGPKLAGATYLYEFYYSFICGRYASKIRELHKTHGPIIRINPSELHITDPEFLPHFHGKKLDKGKWVYQLAATITAGIYSHVEHKQRRSIVGPLFAGTRFSSRLRQVAMNGESINASHLLLTLMNDTMVEYLFGVSQQTVLSEDLKAAASARSFNTLQLACLFRQWPMSLLFSYRHWPVIKAVSPLSKIDARVSEFLKPILLSTPESIPDNYSVAQGLFKKHELYRDPLLLQFECSEFLIGGIEALTYNTSHCLHGLLSEPECIEKLRAELDALKVNGDIWADPRLQTLPYLNAVIKEGLRLNESDVVRFSRESSDPIQYKDFVIPPGTAVSMTEKDINSNPTIYPEPERFNPDRWLGENAELAKKCCISFGLGSRTCVGRDLALYVMTRTLAILVYHYDIRFWNEAQKDGWGRGYLKLFPPKDMIGLEIGVDLRSRA